MLKKFGNSFFWIQHVQIRLEHISKHFYQKMPSQVTFGGFPASLSLYLQNHSYNHSAFICVCVFIDVVFVAGLQLLDVVGLGTLSTITITSLWHVLCTALGVVVRTSCAEVV